MGFLRCFTQPSPHESVLVTRDCALSSMKDYLGETYGGEPDVQPEASVFFVVLNRLRMSYMSWLIIAYV